ncbi:MULTISPECIES: GDP-L-fucose synthase family protein [Hydrogenophaga]|uniref:GDP-L-fucose synthase n=1 Tax=Hydrogenophaga intermedia TaxID=65786 RepID=A0A1L1PE05_HYDIT|nr:MULTISPECIES: GDP-L-fucose synthase [Hydrogenophaga]AOS80005.1 GDP-fucose synthetase [Hydrogenophaga sp. PBC]TMU75389.1 GDP-L-fucose synthase [Hydrogenophaga intermedia]CDN88278.1 GDP-L-fucose synthase [Hydrogenophaga intermedia]
MDRDARIFVAGHRGLVGSAIVRALRAAGHTHLLLRTRDELDLRDPVATAAFFEKAKPDYVFLAAARVGGILANQREPADFIRDNLQIQTNVIHEAWRTGVQRLLFLGSSCIYPRLAPQPLREEYLLTGPLEATNRAYALAKIAGIEMCWAHNRQHGTRFLAAMPTNLYGPEDNFDLDSSHVIPALLRKFHEARVADAPSVSIWGSGEPRREFMHSFDMAQACLFLMNLDDERFDGLLGSDEALTGRFEPPLINIGVGADISIRELAETIAEVVGYDGLIEHDRSKPDGTPRKLMDVSRLNALGFRARIELKDGLRHVHEVVFTSSQADPA